MESLLKNKKMLYAKNIPIYITLLHLLMEDTTKASILNQYLKYAN